MQPAIAMAPARIDLAGGTLDIWPIYLALGRTAVTVNVALDMPSRAEVVPGPPGDARIRLVSRDRDEEITFVSLMDLTRALEGGPSTLGLLGRAVRALHITDGLTLVTESASPPGAGLGASSSLLLCALAALLAASDREDEIQPPSLARLAQDLETGLMGRPTGYQDFYPPLLGGCLALEGRPGGVHAEVLSLDLEALAGRLRLAWTGTPHVSGDANWNTFRAFFEGEKATVVGLQQIAEAARDVRARLRAGDLDGALAAVVAEGDVRRRLAPGVSSPTIDALDAAVRKSGGVGTKILGAGGGGCVLVVLPSEGGAAVDAVLAGGPWQALPLRLAGRGIEVRTD